MFRGLSNWLGLKQPEGAAAGGESPRGDELSAGVAPAEESPERPGEPTEEEQQPTEDPQFLHQAKGLGNYLYNFASAATKKITDSVTETAQTIKKSVEEGKIDDILDKTIIGDFQKEQKKFVEEQHTKKSEAAVPPWVESHDEETIQQQILALSADKRNFLRDPPAGVQFNFDFDQMYPVALVMLQEDELLSKMRFALVPKLPCSPSEALRAWLHAQNGKRGQTWQESQDDKEMCSFAQSNSRTSFLQKRQIDGNKISDQTQATVKEEVFWRNYFYRISLIKQSAQLTALAAQQQASGKEEKSSSRDNDLPLTEAVRPKTPPVVIKSQLKNQEDEEEISTSPGVSEFVSDAFDACNLNQEDLRKEMEQLVLDKKQEEATALEEDSTDWEKELQQELQEYEVVAESEKRDENWDKEIEKMLQEN
ncbi:Synapse-associated protein 1 [Apodemus speciosus]|uniref:Synapse-associated protein 1 n=1 Tax=Apodemus speciosus TaxID=105296 RepID=A0ABQ0FVK6_APOSI